MPHRPNRIGVIVAVLYKSGVIFSSTKTEVIEKYFKSIQTSDFDSFVECFPKEMKNEYEQQRTEGGYGKEQVMKEVLYGDFIESYGSDYTIDVSFGRETKLKESEYGLSEYKSFYGSAPNVSEAYEIVTNVTFKGSKGSEDAIQFLQQILMINASNSLQHLYLVYSARTDRIHKHLFFQDPARYSCLQTCQT